MLLQGYKYNQYDATYRKATFNVIEKGNESCVLEITETASGETFMIDFEGVEPESRILAWRKQELKGHGRSIHYGKAGFIEQLKHDRRKPKKGL